MDNRAAQLPMTIQATPLLILSKDEREELAHHEAVIQRGLATFVDVGNALAAVRENRLYREHFGTFEDYCRERWGMERRHAYRMIDAAQVVRELCPIGHILPVTESQARQLTKLEPEQQREAWQRAVDTLPEDKTMTAAHVAGVVARLKQGMSEEEGQALNSLAVHFSSKTVECYTPEVIIEHTLDVLREIDLDPCSNSKDEPAVPARHHLTQEDDGLSHPWLGRVYMNPPYGREIADWVEYLCQQYVAGNVTEAIALVPSRTDTVWFRQLREYPRCFIWGRLQFVGSENSAPFPSMAVYLGPNVSKFVEVFGDIGDIYQVIEGCVNA